MKQGMPSFVVAAISGLIGAVAVHVTTTVTTVGPAVIVPIAVLLVATAAFVRGQRIADFGTRLLLISTPVAIALGGEHAFFLTSTQQWGHFGLIGNLWRFAFVIALAVVLGAAGAAFTKSSRKPVDA